MAENLVKRLRSGMQRTTNVIALGGATHNPLHLEAADRIEGLEAKLASITSMLSLRIKEHQRLKDMAGSDNSKRREHYRAHALSEALGEVRKIVKGEQDD